MPTPSSPSPVTDDPVRLLSASCDRLVLELANLSALITELRETRRHAPRGPLEPLEAYRIACFGLDTE